MNQKTRTALYSVAICACIISAASAVILTINAHNRKPQAAVTAVEEDKEDEDQPKQERPRRRHPRRGGGGGGFHDGRRGDVTQLLPDGDDFGQVPTPEEFEQELIKGLEEYRSLPPHERFNIDNQMHQTTLFVQTGLDMMRENIHEIPLDELDRIRDDFDRFADAAEQTFFSGIVEQYLTPEEDLTIGEFVRTMHDAQNEFRDLLHSI